MFPDTELSLHWCSFLQWHPSQFKHLSLRISYDKVIISKWVLIPSTERFHEDSFQSNWKYFRFYKTIITQHFYSFFCSYGYYFSAEILKPSYFRAEFFNFSWLTSCVWVSKCQVYTWLNPKQIEAWKSLAKYIQTVFRNTVSNQVTCYVCNIAEIPCYYCYQIGFNIFQLTQCIHSSRRAAFFSPNEVLTILIEFLNPH